jgi:hypothetical protein
MNVALIVIVALLIVVPAAAAVGYLAWSAWRARESALAATDKERSVSTDAATAVPTREESKEETPRLRDLVIENMRKKRKLQQRDDMSATTGVSVVEV